MAESIYKYKEVDGVLIELTPEEIAELEARDATIEAEKDAAKP